MAFFGLTQLGYQEPVREHLCDPKVTPISAFRSGEYRDPNFRLPKTIDKCETPSGEGKHHLPDSPTPFTSQTSGYNRGPCGSHEELLRMRQKHLVNPKDNSNIYRRPLTTSADIGHWRKDEPIHEKEPWTYVKRHVHLDSEMTRFVNEMALTNRDFSLF